jgi:predicted RecB family nuclease
MHPEELRRFKGIKTTAEAIQAAARAFVERCPVWFSPLSPECAQPGIMFDLETIPWTNSPWSWGWTDGDGSAQMIVVAEQETCITLPDGRTITAVRDTDTAWRVFAQQIPSGRHAIYHWSAFDRGVMRSTAPDDVRAFLDGRMVDLLRGYKTCVRFPVNGASIKVVARYLSFEWAEYDSWDAAFRDYRRWLYTGDLDALRRACNYQQADVHALQVVWDWLTTHGA